MTTDLQEISDVISESGVIATLVNHPDYYFYCEQLDPKHFSNETNAVYYNAISYLAKQDVQKIDAYNLVTAMNTLCIKSHPSSFEINDFLDSCQYVSRGSVEEYRVLANNVLDKAFRREMARKLRACESMCFNNGQDEIRQKIYNALDDVMSEYGDTKDIPEYKDIIDEMFEKIESRKSKDKDIGWEFKFPTLNEYVTIDRGELVVFGAQEKVGKSIMLLNCAVDLLKKGCAVLYLDSELSTEQFTVRMLSHLTGIPYKTIKYVNYSNEDRDKILRAKEIIKGWKLTHLYMPLMSDNEIYVVFKKVMHRQGIDVFILDYLKSSDTKANDAYEVYRSVGRRVDLIKNTLCGTYGVAGLAAVQLTSGGRIADSANVSRFASTIIMLRDKTEDEIEADGEEYGMKAVSVYRNRNGEQMSQGDYISLMFDGNRIMFREPKCQPVKEGPV